VGRQSKVIIPYVQRLGLGEIFQAMLLLLMM